MQYDYLKDIHNRQKEFFETGKTLELKFRLDALAKLNAAIRDNELLIVEALKEDLKKSPAETYTTELMIILDEIKFVLKNLKRWMKPKRRKTPLLLFPAKSFIYSEPFGTALIISPWNYPFLLTFLPLIGAIAAGNCCVIKPSELSKASEKVIESIIESTFNPAYIKVVKGEKDTGEALLLLPFNKIFFTGSSAVGKSVMEKAAINLSSVTLELGGKSPCIIHKNVDIDVAAKRVLRGKFTNAGQTCIAPDYIIVHEEIKDCFYNALKKWLKIFFSDNPVQSFDYSRIVNERHFLRLTGYLKQGKIVAGGSFDIESLYIEPTVIEVADLEAPVMQEEIFGPVLPVMTFRNFDDIKEIISFNPDPLSLYVFSEDKAFIDNVIKWIPFGGGCVNDTLMHITNRNLPFGGRGESGVGNYRGLYSFEAFSHKKAVVKNSFRFDLSLKYPPYNSKVFNNLKVLLKLLNSR